MSNYADLHKRVKLYASLKSHGADLIRDLWAWGQDEAQRKEVWHTEVKRLQGEIEHIKKDARAHANVELCEENDRLIDENNRLRAEIELVSK